MMISAGARPRIGMIPVMPAVLGLFSDPLRRAYGDRSGRVRSEAPAGPTVAADSGGTRVSVWSML